MTDVSYVNHGVITAEIEDAAEFHLDQPDENYFPNNSYTSEYTGARGYSMLGRVDGPGFQNIPGNAQTIRIGYWMRWLGWSTSNTELLRIYDPTYSHLTLYILFNMTSWSIEVYEYNEISEDYTVISRAFNINTVMRNNMDWQHIGIYYDIPDGILTLYSNGRVVLNAIGISLTAPNNAFVGKSYLVGNYFYLDDIYLDYSTTVETNEAPPARRFYYAMPNLTGNYSQWTPNGAANNYDCVNDPNAPDDDTTYVLAASNGLLDMYQCGLVTIPVNETPTAALIQAYATLTTGRGAGWGALKFAFQGTMNADYGNTRWIDYNWAEANQWAVVTDRMSDLPQGGEWTVSEFNAGQFGYESANLI